MARVRADSYLKDSLGIDDDAITVFAARSG
jgi:hypothetical protein